MGDSPDWRRNGTFQLLGLDFMVNEQMEFSFIEGNPRPGLDQETKWQAEARRALYEAVMGADLSTAEALLNTPAPPLCGSTTIPLGNVGIAVATPSAAQLPHTMTARDFLILFKVRVAWACA